LEATRRERLQNPRSEAERRVVHLMRLGAIGPASAWLLVEGVLRLASLPQSARSRRPRRIGGYALQQR
jgi:hypothetical protein